MSSFHPVIRTARIAQTRDFYVDHLDVEVPWLAAQEKPSRVPAALDVEEET